MIRKKRLICNTFLLTGVSLLMSCIGIAFQTWLVGRIGSAGIGLYQLVISVTNLLATFAISGIRFASTRLISEELGGTDCTGIRAAMRRCLGYGLLFGVLAGAVLWSLAEPIGFLWIGDARTVRSLRISAVSMPCISLCASLSGYFTACGRVWKPSAVHLVEQIFGIAAVWLCLSRVPLTDIELSCAAVTTGRVMADIASLIMMAGIYLADRRRHYATCGGGARLTARMLKIAVPLAVSAYARSALTTLQNLLVPRGLKAAGYSSNGALAGYGTIQGMVMPIIFFPSCIMSALGELIVPELTEAQVQGSRDEIHSATRRLILLSIQFSTAVGLFMWLFSDMLGLAIYKSGEAGHYIRLLAPLVPVMYTDMTVDGCLKGLGQQVWSMGINIADSLVGLFLVWALLPRFALSGYIALIYITEVLNFVLSIIRLRRVLRAT